MEQKFSLVQQLKTWERSAADVLGIIGTWIAPVPSAYRIFIAAIETLHWNWGMAFILAATIEILGVLSILTALEMWRWNKTRSRAKGERGDEKAPLFIALFIIAFYLFTAITLTMVLEIFPELSKYSNGLLPLVTGVGGGLMAMRISQNDREAHRAERLQNKRDTKSTEGKPKKKLTEPQADAKPKPVNPAERDEAMLAYMKKNPYATGQELAEVVDRSPSWVSTRTKELRSEGKLTKNGHGWEITDQSH